MPERREYPDAHHKVLRAFERRWDESGRVPFETAAVVGKGPFRRGKMQSYLWDLGVETRYLKDIGKPEVLVLGRTWIEGQEKRQTKQLLNRRRGETLRICSQEMLLAWSMTGVDPNERPQTARTFVEGHPALEMVREELEGRWPGTDPIPSGGDGSYEPGQTESPLIRIGYRVGRTNGKPEGRRRKLLRRAFEMELSSFPGDYPSQYIEEWGPARSGQRLERMARHIASRCRSFRRNENADYSEAIADYEDDLGWLKETFYTSTTYGFRWPSSTQA